MEKEKGLLLKGIGGFYYVETDKGIFECKARGAFRKKGITPLVGDNVYISILEDSEEKLGTIEEILPRKNSLIRPPLANIDTLFIISSMKSPVINPYLIDKITAVAVDKGIEPIIVITKTDLDDCSNIKEIYSKTNIKVITTSFEDDSMLEEIKELLKNKKSAFTGNTGVGKSSLLNRLFPHYELETGDISKKLGRGRHTTRQVELLKVDQNSYVADTPGFSTLDIERYEVIKKENLPYCFGEFADYIDNCKFTSCSHTCEKGCSVIQAVQEGKISTKRFESYKMMYSEVKDIKDWENKKG